MKLYGFGTYDWALATLGVDNSPFFFAIDAKNTMLPSVTPQILLRPGTYATFGVSQVGAMNIVGKFGYVGPINPETAWAQFFTQLNPANSAPRELRGIRNDGTLVKIKAVLSVPNFATTELLNAKDASFICATPFFDALGTLAGSGGF